MLIIGLSMSGKPISRLIRWLTGSKASHAYIRFDVAGVPLVLHSTAPGVNFDTYAEFKKHYNIVYEKELNLTPEAEQKALSYALKQIDKPYDILSIIGFMWVLLRRAVCKKNVKNPFQSKKAYHCSEFAASTMKAAGLDIGTIDTETTSPEDILQFLKTLD